MSTPWVYGPRTLTYHFSSCASKWYVAFIPSRRIMSINNK